MVSHKYPTAIAIAAERPTNRDLCAYCGQPAVENDHVPSRKLFPAPRPSDLITVRACSPCNRQSSEDEEYFLNVLLSHEHDGEDIEALRAERFALPRTRRRVDTAASILARTRMGEVRTEAGLVLRRAPILSLELTRIDAVLWKITRGLYWHEFREILPLGCEHTMLFLVEADYLSSPGAKFVIEYGAGRDIGPAIFDYRIAHGENDRHAGLCVILFYRAIIAACLFGIRPPDVETA